MGQSETNSRIGSRARLWTGACVAMTALVVPSLALAHRERPSYFPDPRPDRSVTPAAGGEVPKIRSLASAVTGFGPGEVRVVCKGTGGSVSMGIVRRTVAQAVAHGYRLRPSQPKIQMSAAEGARLVRTNQALAEDCGYHAIQPAVFDSGNNDRVVIMPGRYTEPASRSQPTNDPRCADLVQLDTAGSPTPSYAYQVDLPQRPEPDLRTGARGPRRAGAEPAALQPPGNSR